MQDGFTTNNTRPEKRQKCNRRSALFLLSSSPILTVHVQSLRRSDILRRPALESVSPKSRPTFRQNYIKMTAAICLPSVALVEQVQKEATCSTYFNFVSTTQHVHEVLFGSTSGPTHARKKADVHSSSDHRLYKFA